MNIYKKFLINTIINFTVLLSILVIPFIFVSIYLYKTKEIFDTNKIAEMQQKGDYIYGPGLKDEMYAYKIALIKKRPTAIMTFGSSRVLQFR